MAKKNTNAPKKQLKNFSKQQQQFLIFVPHVEDLEIVASYLKKFPEMQGTTVHAADQSRTEKVLQMRHEEIQYLITTTILERGITLPGIDVIIMGADEDIFSENALVQIAGRVGRSSARPEGLVQAYITHNTLAVVRARQQITTMNKRAVQLKDSD